jgi:Ring finger domain
MESKYFYGLCLVCTFYVGLSKMFSLPCDIFVFVVAFNLMAFADLYRFEMIKLIRFLWYILSDITLLSLRISIGSSIDDYWYFSFFLLLLFVFEIFHKIVIKIQETRRNSPSSSGSLNVVNLELGTQIAISECPICLSEGTLVQILCKHFFHEACIREWVRFESTCPLCRVKLE